MALPATEYEARPSSPSGIKAMGASKLSSLKGSAATHRGLQATLPVGPGINRHMLMVAGGL